MKTSLSQPLSLPILSVFLVSVLCLPEAAAQAALSLPDLAVTSFRGKLTMGKTNDSGTATPVPLPQPGQPVRLPPGTRLDVEGINPNHAVISLPGAGACMITEGSSLRLPEVGETGMTVTFDRHITGSPNRMFLNISAAEMAKHGGAVFRTKNKFESNSIGTKPYLRPNVVVTTTGARCFIIDSQDIQKEDYSSSGACTVGVLDGVVKVEELVTKQKADLKAGQVVLITPEGIGKPRPPTKAEAAYDLGCKLAVLGRDVPARLPAAMKTTASTSAPGTKVNSLGMVFVPVPGTKVMMCVHETRFQDYMPYLAAKPPQPDARRPFQVDGLWGWEDHPVALTWKEAQSFCSWLSQKEGRKYRLPTDEEWSHAVGIGGREKRGTATTPEELGKQAGDATPASNNKSLPAGIGNLADASRWFLHMTLGAMPAPTYDDGFAATAPVMSFKPNKLGIYDLAGNVSEWCEDWFNNDRNTRVARGSSYMHDAGWALKPSQRWSVQPEGNATGGFRYDVGVRIVLEQP